MKKCKTFWSSVCGKSQYRDLSKMWLTGSCFRQPSINKTDRNRNKNTNSF